METHYRIKSKKPIVSVSLNFEEQLTNIYKLYNRQKLSEIPKMIEHFENESKKKYLLESMLEKYDISDEHLHLFGVHCDIFNVMNIGSERADR